jgi:hypothetical protein
MGNTGSSARRRRRHRNQPPPPPAQPSQTEIVPNRYVYAAATPYPSNQPPAYYSQQNGYYPPPSALLPAPYDNHHRQPCAPVFHQPVPYVEHQKAVTIRNDVNLKKETFKIISDQENPKKSLISFTFDATVPCSITIIFFAKEGEDCNLTATKETSFAPVTVHFPAGLCQKFNQPSGTGIDFSVCADTELIKADLMDIYPLAIKAEATENGSNAQITHAVFEKDKDEFKVKVLKQFLWVNGKRYELQEIYGIGNSVDGDSSDADAIGKECVICLSEPQDTTVLPCRHMCMCSGCAKVLRFKTDRCPICRQPVERLLEIKVDNSSSQD